MEYTADRLCLSPVLFLSLFLFLSHPLLLFLSFFFKEKPQLKT